MLLSTIRADQIQCSGRYIDAFKYCGRCMLLCKVTVSSVFIAGVLLQLASKAVEGCSEC